MENKEKLTAQEVREQLLEVWTKCEFGVKERVSRVHSWRMIQYILKTPTYSKAETILEIIETIKEQADVVKEEAIAMSEDIKSTLK